jgi:hypothetical protein
MTTVSDAQYQASRRYCFQAPRPSFGPVSNRRLTDQRKISFFATIA